MENLYLYALLHVFHAQIMNLGWNEHMQINRDQYEKANLKVLMIFKKWNIHLFSSHFCPPSPAWMMNPDKIKPLFHMKPNLWGLRT